MPTSDGRYNIPVVEEDGRLVAVVDIFTLAEATQAQVSYLLSGLSLTRINCETLLDRSSARGGGGTGS